MTSAQDIPEVRCSAKNNIGFYVRAGKQFLLGTKGKDGSPGKEAVDVIQLSGLGGAISTCVGAVGRLTSSGIAKVIKVETGYPILQSKERVEQDEEAKEAGGRGVALVKITLKVIPESRKQPDVEESAVN